MDEIADEGIDKLIAEIAKEAHEECQRPPSPPHPSGLAAKDRNWADMKEKERHAAESLGSISGVQIVSFGNARMRPRLAHHGTPP